MKALNFSSLILLFFILSCKDKAKPTIQIKPLTTAQMEKAISMADSIKVIGEPAVKVITIWDTTLKEPVRLHETTTELEVFVSLDEEGNPIPDSTTTTAMKIRERPSIISITCSYSCKKDSPESECRDASGCKFDRVLRQCTEPNCGSGCSLLRGCQMEIKRGFSTAIMY